MKKKHVVLSIVLSLVLLLAAVAAGLNAIFSVYTVQVDFTVHSAKTKEESLALQEELNELVGKSTVFLDLQEVEDTVKKYPYFRIEKLEKDYPQTIVLALAEREERFAVAVSDGYQVYDSAGDLLATQAENSNRYDGGANILLYGFEQQEERFQEAVALCGAMSEEMTDLRMNVRSVTLSRPVPNDRSADSFVFTMSEGVIVELLDPSAMGVEKAKRVARFYLDETDTEMRITGKITVLQADSGEIICRYSASVGA